MFKVVELGRNVNPDELETALLEAAKDVGLHAKKTEHYRDIYRLGSVREDQEYKETSVLLRGRFFPVAEIEFNKKYPTHWVALLTGTSSRNTGMGSKATIEKYLCAVSARLTPATS